MQAWSRSWLQSLGGGWVWKKAVCGRSAGTKICIQLSHGTLRQVLNIASVWTWTICYRHFSDWRKTGWSLSPCVNSAEEREIQRTGKQAVLALSFAKCKAIVCLNWHKLGVIPLQPTDRHWRKAEDTTEKSGLSSPSDIYELCSNFCNISWWYDNTCPLYFFRYVKPVLVCPAVSGILLAAFSPCFTNHYTLQGRTKFLSTWWICVAPSSRQSWSVPQAQYHWVICLYSALHTWVR